MKNYLRTGLFLFLFLLFAVSSVFGAEHPNSLEKRVLILYSFTINFAPDFQFVTEFTKEISSSSGLKLRVKHVELDAFTREKSTDEALSRRLAPLLPGIRRGHYDVIIPIGQIAINLLCRHSKEIPEKADFLKASPGKRRHRREKRVHPERGSSHGHRCGNCRSCSAQPLGSGLGPVLPPAERHPQKQGRFSPAFPEKS